MRRSLELAIRDSVVDPDLPTAVPKYRVSGGRRSYQVFLWIDGPDLALVDRTRWVLHPTFPDPIVDVARSFTNQRCKLTIWSWGLFEAHATVVLKDRRELELRHMLDYDAEFTKLKFVEG